METVNDVQRSAREGKKINGEYEKRKSNSKRVHSTGTQARGIP
jgi:hypothetical protein